MRKPESVKLEESSNGKKIVIKTFDVSQFIFQIVLILVPFLLIEILIVNPDTIVSVVIFIAGITLIGYWITTNLLSRYDIFISHGRLTIKTGFPLPHTKGINLKSIVSIKIKRRSGKTGGAGRGGVSTTGPNVDDYFIVTRNSEDYLMIPKCTKKQKEFVKIQIEEALRAEEADKVYK